MRCATAVLSLATFLITCSETSAVDVDVDATGTNFGDNDSRGGAKGRRNLAQYTYDDYVKEFKKDFKDEVEYLRRKQVFHRNLDRIRVHNAKENVSYRKGVNQFTDVEGGPMFGLKKRSSKSDSVQPSNEMLDNGGSTLSSKRVLDELPFDITPVSDLPKSVDWRRTGKVTAVKDQGNCGSCWAFASTATLESHIAITTGTLYDLSPQELVSCVSNDENCGGSGGCDGATFELAFDFVVENGGMVQEYQMGYTSYYGDNGQCYIVKDPEKSYLRPIGGPDPGGVEGAVATINGYILLPRNSYETLMNAVAKTGPVGVSVAASGWHDYESGVFVMEGENGGYDSADNLDINHATSLVGYGTDEESGLDYWLVRNSWSPTWGEDGYIRLLREDPSDYDSLDEICGTDETPQHGSACEGETDPVTVCGTSGILYEDYIPVGGHLI